MRPVFIVGINRTGTTFLHRLLARDPRFWTLRSYELAEPVVPDGDYAKAWTDADIRRARLLDVFIAAGFFESFAGAHHIDVDEPEEDLGLLRHTFLSWSNTNIYQVPEYGRWLATTGSQCAYGYHRRAMQHFTWQRRPRHSREETQWLLKAPVHLMELEALIGAYPDACFIQTHREPREFTGSWVSLIEQLRSRTTEPTPRRILGEEQLADMSTMLDRAVAFRESRPDLQHRWCDVSYVDLIDDPWASVQGIYEHFGWTLDPAAVAAMEAWQERQADQRRHEVRHSYDLKDYDLTLRRSTPRSPVTGSSSPAAASASNLTTAAGYATDQPPSTYQVAPQRIDGTLGAGAGRPLAGWTIPQDRAGIHDRGPRVAGHERDNRPRHVEDPLDGDIVEPVPVLLRAAHPPGLDRFEPRAPPPRLGPRR